MLLLIAINNSNGINNIWKCNNLNLRNFKSNNKIRNEKKYKHEFALATATCEVLSKE